MSAARGYGAAKKQGSHSPTLPAKVQRDSHSVVILKEGSSKETLTSIKSQRTLHCTPSYCSNKGRKLFPMTTDLMALLQGADLQVERQPRASLWCRQQPKQQLQSAGGGTFCLHLCPMEPGERMQPLRLFSAIHSHRMFWLQAGQYLQGFIVAPEPLYTTRPLPQNMKRWVFWNTAKCLPLTAQKPPQKTTTISSP